MPSQTEMIALATDLVTRPAAWDDLSALVELANACTMAQVGQADFSLDAFEREWGAPDFDVGRDTRVVLAPDGRPVAVAEAWVNRPIPDRTWAWVMVHPAWEGQGIGRALLAWAEARAREEIPHVPHDLRVSLLSGTSSGYEPVERRLRAFGMQPIRHFWRMVVELDEAPAAPAWPDGLHLRPYRHDADALAVYRVVNEAFRDHWGHVERPEEDDFPLWSHHHFTRAEFDPSLWFLAIDGDEIAGVALCTPSRSEDPDMGWVNQLAVRRPWRQRGLGQALLLHAFGELHSRGKARVGLGVDAQNLTGALRLYERVGMRVDRRNTNYEKELRPGRERSNRAAPDTA